MSEQLDPWWPLKWRQSKDDGGGSYFTASPDALVDLPGFEEPLHVGDFTTGEGLQEFAVYIGERSLDTVAECRTLLELRAALLNLAYPGGNDDGAS